VMGPLGRGGGCRRGDDGLGRGGGSRGGGCVLSGVGGRGAPRAGRGRPVCGPALGGACQGPWRLEVKGAWRLVRHAAGARERAPWPGGRARRLRGAGEV